ARDLEFGLVAQQHVLDDGEPESRSARCAGAAAIDAIEALREPRNVLGRNADARVGDAEDAAAVGIHVPRKGDRSLRRRIPDGVADEIAERARKLVATAEDRRRFA